MFNEGCESGLPSQPHRFARRIETLEYEAGLDCE